MYLALGFKNSVDVMSVDNAKNKQFPLRAFVILDFHRGVLYLRTFFVLDSLLCFLKLRVFSGF